MPEGTPRRNVCWCVADTSSGKLTESYVIPDVWGVDRWMMCMNLSEDHAFEWRMFFH